MYLLGMSPAPTDPRNRRRLVALIAAGIVLLLLASVGALAQTNIRPDMTPRVPPQPGQGLPLEALSRLRRTAPDCG